MSKKIYVVCPCNKKTGGTELLHQLVYQLNQNGFDSDLAYFHKNNRDRTITVGFEKYIDKFVRVEDIPKECEDVLVVPEILAFAFERKFSRATKVLWWLSYDNFELYNGLYNGLRRGNFLYLCLNFLRAVSREGRFLSNYSVIDDYKYHLVQSQYSKDKLFEKKVSKEKVFELTDYLNDVYLNVEYTSSLKENIILYNPKKGFKFTKKLITKYPELNWKPLRNMTSSEVKEVLLKSKVYIDFGNHPGKDRFPREAAMCGCCVITSKKGSASNKKDVSILERFKFKDDNKSIEQIIDSILYIFENYEKENQKFDDYRRKIKTEKAMFVTQATMFFNNLLC
jgi:hypothetical protein